MHNALDPRDLVPDEAEQLLSAGYPAEELLDRARQAATDDDLTALAAVETELARARACSGLAVRRTARGGRVVAGN